MIAMLSTPASRLKLAGLAFVFLWFFVGGIAHFVATETEMRIVPPLCQYDVLHLFLRDQ